MRQLGYYSNDIDERFLVFFFWGGHVGWGAVLLMIYSFENSLEEKIFLTAIKLINSLNLIFNLFIVVQCGRTIFDKWRRVKKNARTRQLVFLNEHFLQ